MSANDILNLLAGNEINIGSKNITINSDTLQILPNGFMRLKDLTYDGNNFNIESDTYILRLGSSMLSFTSKSNPDEQVFIDMTEAGEPQLVVSKTGEYTGITSNRITIAGAGQAMYGKTWNHKYQIHWTGSKLQFLVDGDVVREL